MSSPTPDPRATITPESFAIADDLVGLPLARPSRRLVAILLDLIPVAIMAALGLDVLIAGLAAVGVWRLTGSWSRKRKIGILARGLAAIVAFTTIADFNVSNPWYDPAAEPEQAEAAMAAQALRFVPPEYRTPELEAAIEELAGTDTASAPTGSAADSVILTYAAALERGDSAAASGLRPSAELAIAGARISGLRSERDRLQAEARQLREENDQLRKTEGRGFLGLLSGLADDLGLGFGWGALYFTTFLVLGNGQTPGKRIMGIRVIRLDGKPIGWWYAFERFGSYFASLTTGLVGFAQIFWDRNRQALHDKVVETVVIRVRHAPPLHVRRR